jgi:hypothetical protein
VKLIINIANLLRNLVRAKVTSSGIVLNSGDCEERVSTITIGNAAGKITCLAGKLENSLNPFVIYGAKVNQTIPRSQSKTSDRTVPMQARLLSDRPLHKQTIPLNPKLNSDRTVPMQGFSLTTSQTNHKRNHSARWIIGSNLYGLERKRKREKSHECHSTVTV